MALKREANLRRQVVAFTAVLLAAWWLNVTSGQWLFVLLISVAVLSMELVNSSIEALADAVHPQEDERIERAKDMAAGAVLVVSLASLVVALAVFGPAAGRFLSELFF